jgi:drug/metabolite transporter (DMT)-like permease
MAKSHALPYAEEQSINWRPYLIIAVGIVIGASAPIFMRLAQGEGMPALVIATLRLVLAALTLTPLALGHYRRELLHVPRRDALLAALAGSMLALHFLSLVTAFGYASILIVGVLAGSSPLWSALLEKILLRAQLNRMIWVGLFITLTGGTLIGLSGMNAATSGGGSNPPLGAGLGLIAAVLAALYFISGRSARQRISFIPYVWLVFASGGLTGLTIMLLTGTPLIGHAPDAYLWVILLTLGPQLISQSAFSYALAYLSATYVSVSGQIITVIAAGAAFVVFAELPSSLQVLGSAIIISGVVLASLGQARAQRAAKG